LQGTNTGGAQVGIFGRDRNGIGAREFPKRIEYRVAGLKDQYQMLNSAGWTGFNLEKPRF